MEDASGYLSGCSISTGAVRYNDLAYILCTRDALAEERIPHTRFFSRDQARWGGQGSAMACRFCNYSEAAGGAGFDFQVVWRRYGPSVAVDLQKNRQSGMAPQILRNAAR